ncbi:MAG: SRPBCC family protein [Rhodobacterales bacterium]|nr:SRPBCC family protein [Rhodobacterales bacterium]
MKFSTKEDIEAPIAHVFSKISDFDSFENSARRRGAEIARADNMEDTGVGMCWDVGFMMRGKQRQIVIELEGYDAPNTLEFVSRSKGLGGIMTVDLVALSRGRTRLGLDLELNPQTLSARLLVQSLKLARGNLNKRFHLRVADYAKDMEDQYKAGFRTAN